MKFHNIFCLFLLAHLNLCLTLTTQNSPTQDIKNIDTIIDLRQLKVDFPSGQKFTQDIYFVLTNKQTLEAKTEKQLTPDDTVCAYAKLEDTIEEIGWHQLHVEAGGKCGRLGTMYAAGWVEGYLSSDEISNYYKNYISKDSDLMQNLPEMKQVLDNVYRNTLEKIQKGKVSRDQKEQTFWNGIELFSSQFEGIVAGFLTRNKNLDREDIMLINSNGELSDLLDALPTFLNQQNDEILTQKSSREIKKRVNKFLNTDSFLAKEFSLEEAHQLRVQGLLKSHCSAFIKLLRDSNGLVKDVLMAHGTWDDFEGMLKIMKKYNIKIQTAEDQPLADYKIIFPSYPGSLTSQDDFYVRGDGMMLMETSLNVYDDSIYQQNLDPAKYLPTFLKLAASNYLGNTAKKWVDYFSFINTHTYNSQWMVLDVGSISNSLGKKNLVNSTFYVLEQIPGVMLSKDMTNILNTESYWSSFNMPIFDETYEKSGAKSVYDRTGSEEFSRTQDPRAVRFRNLQSTVKDVESLKDLIRLNTASKDGSPQTSQIAPRCDLSNDVYGRQLFGETDAKIANYKLAKDVSLVAVSGPTQVNSGPFSFPDDVYQSLKGVPQTWDFDWEQYTLKL